MITVVKVILDVLLVNSTLRQCEVQQILYQGCVRDCKQPLWLCTEHICIHMYNMSVCDTICKKTMAWDSAWGASSAITFPAASNATAGPSSPIVAQTTSPTLINPLIKNTYIHVHAVDLLQRIAHTWNCSVENIIQARPNVINAHMIWATDYTTRIHEYIYVKETISYNTSSHPLMCGVHGRCSARLLIEDDSVALSVFVFHYLEYGSQGLENYRPGPKPGCL